MKNCPSCNAKPEQLKGPGIRYTHSSSCNLGKAEIDYRYSGKICETDVISFKDQVGDSWKQFYYG